MAKTTETYWNTLLDEKKDRWIPIEGMETVAEKLTLAIDEDSGDYTCLIRFKPGADTTTLGSKSHTYPEEIMILKGRLYDAALKSVITPAGHLEKSMAHSKLTSAV